MARVAFDFKKPDLAVVRQVVIERLRDDSAWNQFDVSGEGFLRYVEMQGNQISRFIFYANDVLWQFLTVGVLAPGFNESNLKLPFFHLTEFGNAFIKAGDWPAYDSSKYLLRLAEGVKNPDQTVLAYLAEGLRSFERGNVVAAAVLLGIAAERVFLLLCEATLSSLSDPSQKNDFSRLLDRYQMKPKLDWLHSKFGELQKKGPKGFPDNACFTVTAIYDLLRSQRNDLGHPREKPPSLQPEDVLVSLQVFPRFFEAAEVIRSIILNSKI